MVERSKTNKEIYDQKYTFEKVVESPMLCAEAIGYLKALKEYFPSEQKWVDDEMTVLMISVLLHTL